MNRKIVVEIAVLILLAATAGLLTDAFTARADVGQQAARAVATAALGAFTGNAGEQATGAATLVAGTAEHYAFTAAPERVVISNASTSGTRILVCLNATTWADPTIAWDLELAPGQRLTLPLPAYGPAAQVMLTTDVMITVPAGGGNLTFGSINGFNVVGYFIAP